MFNAQSRRRQAQDFNALRGRLYKLGKTLDPVIGYCYGRKEQKIDGSSSFRELAGQPLWEELTGDPDFYLDIIRLMKEKPQEHQNEYQIAWTNAINLFTGEFIREFCKQNGEIDWEKLVRFNSGRTIKKLSVEPKSMRIGPGGSQKLVVTASYIDGSSEDVTLATDTRFIISGIQTIVVTDDGTVNALSNAIKGDLANLTVEYTYKTAKAKVVVK